MSIATNKLDEQLLGDLLKVISASPLLLEAYSGLPQHERDAVDGTFLKLIWETILEGATASRTFVDEASIIDETLLDKLDIDKEK